MVSLSPHQRDRARGVLLATAAGDALGAPFEFGPALPASFEVSMTGGGSFGWALGEWTDDTAMAICIARVAATSDLRSAAAQDEIVAAWVDWARTAPDVGNQTRAVLASAELAATARAASDALHARTGHTAGNGSLMRTAPVALAYLDEPDVLAETARSLSALTHADPEAGEACALWCLAMRHAVLAGELDARAGLPALGPRAGAWAERLDAAEAASPADFSRNGWVVEALQAAWSALSSTSDLPSALSAAVRGGRDTDTVAAIAGGLAGAAYGASAVPEQWRSVLHGWPGMHADDLVALADRIVAR